MDYKQLFNDNLETLRYLLRIKSIYDSNSVSLKAPYGKGVQDALLFMKDLANKDHFIVREYDNQAISVSNVFKPHRRIDIASHLDVVNVDDKWTYDPFGATVVDDKIYGRGTSDMKTAAFLTYLSLKLLKEKYKDTPNEIRLVFGTDEERTMADMRHYRSEVSKPLFAFSPDGCFPMANGEKGALMWTLSGDYDGIIESLDGGIQCNIVAPGCKIILKNTKYLNGIEDYIKNNNLNATVRAVFSRCEIEITGKAMHCSRAWLGRNAIMDGLKMIAEVCGDQLCKNLYEIFSDCYGEGLDHKVSTEFDTCLSVNVGILKIENGKVFSQVDARYPFGMSSADLTDVLKKKCIINASLDYDDEPTLVSLDDKYVKVLLNTYRKNTLDFRKPIISGGVSYSKVFKHCVTFGMSPLGKSTAHQADEYVTISECVKALKIYYEVIEKLAFMEI